MPQGRFHQLSGQNQTLDRIAQSNHSPRNRRTTRPPVRLQNIAVDSNRPLPQSAQIERRPKRPTNQTADFTSPRIRPSALDLPFLALTRRSRHHCILRSQPSTPLPKQKRRNFLLYRSRAEHPSVSLLDEHRALRILRKMPLNRNLPQSRFAHRTPPHSHQSAGG